MARNTRDLSPGQAFDKLMALQDSLARSEAEAVANVRARANELAARILCRVPMEHRQRVITMLAAVPEAERLATELLQARRTVSIEAGPIELKQSEPSDVIDAEYEDPAVSPVQPAQPTSFRSAIAAVADALPEEELPKGAATPYEPTQRLTGKARAR